MILVKNKWMKWIMAILFTIIIVSIFTILYINYDKQIRIWPDSRPMINYADYWAIGILSSIFFGIPTFFIIFTMIKIFEKDFNIIQLLKPNLITIIGMILMYSMISTVGIFVFKGIGQKKPLVQTHPYPTQIKKSLNTDTDYNSIWWGYILNVIFWVSIYFIFNSLFNKPQIKKKNG